MLRDLRSRVSRAGACYLGKDSLAMSNEAPLVSFTFDDVPESAYLNGAPILESCGVGGTFYIAVGTCGKEEEYWRVLHPEQVKALHDQGHEIGGHTFSHTNVQMLSAAEMHDEVRRNDEWVKRLCGDIEIENFAYPFGDVSLARKLQLQRRYASCRGIYEGINFGSIDLGLLKVIALYDRVIDLARIASLLDEAARCNGWIIFYTHDVAVKPSWIGCSPKLLEQTVRFAKSRGIECATIRQGLKRIGRPTALAPVSVANAVSAH